MSDVVLDVRAYAKMVLHAMKYPHRAVNGLFLAEKRRPVAIVDAVPLFHLALALTPMLEVAMMQVEQYCREHSLLIAGYYQANEHVRDASPDFIAYRIADKVYENFPDACLVMLDNQKMDEVAPPFHLYQFSSDGKWRLKDKNSVHLEQGVGALGVARALVSGGAHRTLEDFDTHLDDIGRDWSNAHINAHVDRCCLAQQ